MDTATKTQLVLDYYEPSKYQGVTMSVRGTVWRNTFGGKFPFSLDISMDKHIESKGINLATVFSKVGTSVIAFDLDGDTDLYAIIADSNILTDAIKEVGFIPLVYISGGKGLHVEIRMSNKASCSQLKELVNIIKTLAVDRGCQYIDKVYPSNHAYRMFGCRHYKTNVFTGILKSTVIESGVEQNRILSEQESWEEFQRYLTNDCRANTLIKVENAIEKYKEIVAIPKVKVKNKQKKEASPKASVKEIHYSIENLQQIHTQGLYKDYTRYLTSFQLGRYFKEVLHLTEGQARVEIDKWLSRHYRTSSNYFGDATGSKIKSAYAKCVKETIDNCMRGYACGKSIKANQTITFSKRKTLKYVDDLKITKEQKVALRYLIRTAEEYSSFTFYHSLEQLAKGFKATSKTVSAWINKFVEMGVLTVISKGAVIGGKNISSTYKLTIPDNCYEVEVIADDEIKTIPQKKVYILRPSRNIINVHCIKTFVHEKENKYRLKPLL